MYLVGLYILQDDTQSLQCEVQRSPSLPQRSKSFLQMFKILCLFDSASCFGNYRKLTLWKAVLWWMTSQAAQ